MNIIIVTCKDSAPEMALVCGLNASLPVLVLDGGAIPDDIQWMPPGRHTFTPHVNGEPKEITMTVDAALANRFAAEVQQLRSEAAAGNGDVPFLDFNHEDGAASAEVLDLYWGGDDAKKGGIRANVKWSAAGRAALEGKTFRRFSPQWLMDKNTFRPTGVGVNLGGLVNRAAFQTIQPVVAKRGVAAGEPQETTMNDADKKEISTMISDALKPLSEQLTALAKKPEAETAAAKNADNNKIIVLEDRIKALETSTTKANEADADAAVALACARGAIPAQDEATKAFWKKAIVADAAAKDQLAKLPDNPALATVAQGANGRGAKGATAGEHEFITKAKEFGKAKNITDESEAQAKFAGTADGKQLYEQYRESLAKK